MASDTTSNLVSMVTLGQLHALDVAARAVVDGLHAGSHRSPFKGHSVDFADHRPYVSGDDLRHLDWKVLGRRDRLVLKRFEAETDLGCTLVVDGSGQYGLSGRDRRGYQVSLRFVARRQYGLPGDQPARPRRLDALQR